MGTAGAAWATIAAQGVSFLGSLVYLKRHQLSFSFKKIEFHWGILLAILKVGLPTAIQMVVVNTAYLLGGGDAQSLWHLGGRCLRRRTEN